MIEFVSNNKYVTVEKLHNYSSRVWFSGQNSFTGSLRLNQDTQCIEVYDGINWRSFTNLQYAINLNPTTLEILEWAEKKMKKEKQMEELAEKNQTMKLLLNQYKNVEEKLEVILRMLEEN